MLEDGRLLITGGTALDEAGIKSTLLFDPSGGPTHHWTLADTMFARRWYPDNALLPSGVVVTTAGSASNHFIAVGGRVGGAQDTTTRMLQRYVVAPGDTCEPNAVPTKSNIPSVGLPLAPFSDAAATDVCCSAMFAFGGKNASGSC